MLGAILGGAASALGSIGGVLIGGHSAKAANAQAIEASKHAVQWRVEDMRRAGINPILAAHSGSGFAAAQPTIIPAPAPDLSGVVNSATSIFDALTKRQQQQAAAAGIKSQIELQALQGANSAADAKLKVAQADATRAATDLTGQQILTEAARRANFEANTGLSSARAVREHLQATQDRVISDYLKTPIGAESARTNFDNKTGGVVGNANAIGSYLDRLFGSSNSAKKVKSQQPTPKLFPNDYQQRLIEAYKRERRK